MRSFVVGQVSVETGSPGGGESGLGNREKHSLDNPRTALPSTALEYVFIHRVSADRKVDARLSGRGSFFSSEIIPHRTGFEESNFFFIINDIVYVGNTHTLWGELRELLPREDSDEPIGGLNERTHAFRPKNVMGEGGAVHYPGGKSPLPT